ncbi:NAD(P)/FAD-dependent oxidoreductase [Micrococcus terreus]|uniref:NAD(P)/FAD-dependent oxidoreductase n=1 Tax=Micrococcus terreus TaxID=574650 RepID=UPI003AFA27A2
MRSGHRDDSIRGFCKRLTRRITRWPRPRPEERAGQPCVTPLYGALLPELNAHAGGVFLPNEAHIDGRAFTEALIHRVERLGATSIFGDRVIALKTQGDRVVGVESSSGVQFAGHVVLATGASTEALTRSVGLKLPLAGAKGYIVDLEPGLEDARVPIGLKDDMAVATPYADRVRLAGTLELVGNDLTPNYGRIRTIRQAAVKALPYLAERKVIRIGVGMRPCSADGLPIVGPTRAAEGLSIATGHGQQGIVLAPATGQLIADQLTADADPMSTADLSPDRFRRMPGP